MLNALSLDDANVMRCPFGVQTGNLSKAGLNVSSVMASRSQSYTQMSRCASRIDVAMRFPSGEIRMSAYDAGVDRKGCVWPSSPIQASEYRLSAAVAT